MKLNEEVWAIIHESGKLYRGEHETKAQADKRLSELLDEMPQWFAGSRVVRCKLVLVDERGEVTE